MEEIAKKNMAPKLFQNHPTVMGEKLALQLRSLQQLDILKPVGRGVFILVNHKTHGFQPKLPRTNQTIAGYAQIFRFRINQKTCWPKKAQSSENLGFQRQTMRRNHLDEGRYILGLRTNLTANYMCSDLIRQTLRPVGYTYQTSINLKGAGFLRV